jgi:hypothetical protein
MRAKARSEQQQKTNLPGNKTQHPPQRKEFRPFGQAGCLTYFPAKSLNCGSTDRNAPAITSFHANEKMSYGTSTANCREAQKEKKNSSPPGAINGCMDCAKTIFRHVVDVTLQIGNL